MRIYSPQQEPGAGLPWRTVGLAAIVVLAAVVGYAVNRGGGSPTPVAASSSSAAPASSSPPAALIGRPINPAAGRLLVKSERAVANQAWVDATITTSPADPNAPQTTDQIAIGRGLAEDVETVAGQPAQQVFLVGKVAYVHADQSALTLRDGIDAKVAAAAQNRWISLRPGDKPYLTVTRIFSLGDPASVVGGVPFYGPYSGIDRSLVSTTSTAETNADVIYGWWDTGHSAFAYLSVEQATPHLPLDYSGGWGGPGAGSRATAVYSYGAQFQDPPPRHATNWAALRRTVS